MYCPTQSRASAPVRKNRKNSVHGGGSGRVRHTPISTSQLVLGMFITLMPAAAVFAAAPVVRFDTGPTASCSDATPAELAKIDPGHRLVKATMHVSALVGQSAARHDLEYLYEFVNPTGSVRFVDYEPKTALGTDLAGKIGVDKKKEATKSLGLNVSGSFEHLVRATGVGDLGTKDSVQLHYELKAPQTAILAAGTIERGTGVYFKIRESADATLEGEREFTVVMRVPTEWRADMLFLRCEVRDRGHREVKILNTSRFVIGLYRAGDEQAMRAAEDLLQTEAVLRRTVARKHAEIERLSMPSVVHRIGVLLDVVEPRVPKAWLDQLVFGPIGGVRDDFTRHLPDDVEQRLLAFVHAKQRIYQLSGNRLLIMALSRSDHRW